ncbi:MAG: glycosyltransferase family 2 protein [Lachnospiraceae bacterium]|nr:glycosyltransferase family 2 protein [Lachnospiraceae bacterium]
MVKVSFIVPVYGVERYINQCIDSILNQTLNDFELILIDDGSPDRSPQICDEYAKKDSRIKVIHKVNEGVAIARNTGLEIASGEYAYIVDSDDWIEADAAEKLYKSAKEKSVDCVMSDCVLHYENGNQIRMQQFSQKFYTEDKDTIQKLQEYVLCQKYSPYYSPKSQNGYAAPWGKFIRMSVIKDNNLSFDPDVKGIFDDGLFSLNIFEYIKSFYYGMEHTYNYRIVGTSITHKFKDNAIALLRTSFGKIDEFIVKHGKEQYLRKPFYAHVSRFFIFRLDSYFFNSENKKTYKEIKKELLEVLDSKYFMEAVENVRMEDLSKQYRIAIKLAKKKNVYGLKIFVKLRRIYLKVRKR